MGAQEASREFIAESFLRMLKNDKEPTPEHVAYNVRTAAKHGVSAERIAALSGVPLNRVVLLLAESD